MKYIIIISSVIIWGAIGGFDVFIDSYECMNSEYNILLENFLETVELKDNIIQHKTKCIEHLETEISQLQNIIKNQEEALNMAKDIIVNFQENIQSDDV